MQVSSRFTVKCAQDEVFKFVSTPEKLAHCIPGCSDLKSLTDDSYGAILAVDIAFLKLKFDVTVRLTEVNEPNQIKAVIDGKPKALAGKLAGSVDLQVAAIDEDSTEITYLLDQSITGKLGGIGQSVFRAKCEEMGNLFAENLRTALMNPSEEVMS